MTSHIAGEARQDADPRARPSGPGLTSRVRRLGLGTGRANIASLTTAEVHLMLADDDLGITGPAFRRLGCPEGIPVVLIPGTPTSGPATGRGKIAGRSPTAEDLAAIVRDLAGHRYAQVAVAAAPVGGDVP